MGANELPRNTRVDSDQIGPRARDAKDTRDQRGEGGEVTAFRPFFRARYIRLGGYQGFRSATPQAHIAGFQLEQRFMESGFSLLRMYWGHEPENA